MNAPRTRYSLFLFALGAVLLIAAGISTQAFAASPAISLQTISSGQMVSPVYITNAGDGSKRLFVCDQVGQIRIIHDEMLLPTPFLDLSSKLVPLVSSYDETGLLCMAFHPGFSNPSSPGYKRFYVFYSAQSPNALGNSSISAISVGSPCTITTPAPHGLTTGAVVAISGVSGGTFSPVINATYTVAVVDATHFTVPVNCSSNSGVGLTSAQVTPTNPVYCRSTISEFQVSANNPNVADPTTERVVLAFDKPQDNHNGSQLAFGPDGDLYISVGDGGSQHDNDYGHTGGFVNAPIKSGNLGNAQDTTRLLGKILRIDPLGTNGPGGTYGIPSDNPFASTGGGVRPEIYCFGMRNPWRFSFDTDPMLGSRMIEADVGQNDVEEINLIVSGGNYGWRIMEGSFPHDSTAPSGGGTLINPVAQYFHPIPSSSSFASHFPKIGTSIIGGYVYRGSALSGLTGQYLFADWSAVGIGTATSVLMSLDSSSWTLSQSSIIGSAPFYITSFGVDESGEIYVAAKVATGPVNSPATNLPGGAIYKIVPASVGQVNFATLTPLQDNTIFADATTSSDARGYLYAGEDSTAGSVRRALLAFDIAGQLPAGAVIGSAQLMLNMNSTAAVSSSRMSLIKLIESWGQGTSGPSSGSGSMATENDATWTDRFYDLNTPTLWTTAGGTYLTTAISAIATGKPCAITTTAPHGLITGVVVVISGVTGGTFSPAINAPFTVTVLDSTHFTVTANCTSNTGVDLTNALVTPISAVNTAVGTANGIYTWTASSRMVADLQGWYNTPSTNNGWLLEGSETSTKSVRRFDSMTDPAGGTQPTLQITYLTSGQPTWRESWLQAYFGPPGTYVSDTADPTGDGLNNLLDYAYGYSPLVANQGYSSMITNPSTAGLQTSLTTNGENNTFTTTFLCDPRAGDLTYQLQSSSDLVSWTTIVQVVGGGVPTGSAYVSEAVNPGAAPVQVVTAVETLPAVTKHFTRLVVTRTYQQ